MREPDILGAVVAAAIIGAGALAGWWLRRRHQAKIRRVIVDGTPMPGNDFTAAIWNAQGAVSELQRVILTGNSEALHAALYRMHRTGHTLAAQLLDREESVQRRAREEARHGVGTLDTSAGGEPPKTINQLRAEAGLKPYAGRRGSVTVTGSETPPGGTPIIRGDHHGGSRDR